MYFDYNVFEVCSRVSNRQNVSIDLYKGLLLIKIYSIFFNRFWRHFFRRHVGIGSHSELHVQSHQPLACRFHETGSIYWVFMQRKYSYLIQPQRAESLSRALFHINVCLYLWISFYQLRNGKSNVFILKPYRKRGQWISIFKIPEMNKGKYSSTIFWHIYSRSYEHYSIKQHGLGILTIIPNQNPGTSWYLFICIMCTIPVADL